MNALETVCGSRLESVALTVKLDDCGVVGVPEITPALDSVSPAGSDPPVTEYVTRATKGLTKAGACHAGQVRLVIRQGKKLLRKRVLALSSKCTYHAISQITPAGAAPLRIKVTFLGTLAMRPKSSHTQKLTR